MKWMNFVKRKSPPVSGVTVTGYVLTGQLRRVVVRGNGVAIIVRRTHDRRYLALVLFLDVRFNP
jgi:hypothetical protein